MSTRNDAVIEPPGALEANAPRKLSGMRLFAKAAAFLAIGGAGFLGGTWFQHGDQRPSATPRKDDARRILYYQDPMHPAYTSDKPGIAPDCGMKLVPVYAGEAPGAGGAAAAAIQISPAKQQLLGIVTGTVEKSSYSFTLQATGQVTAAETQTIRLFAGTEGWIREISSKATGTLVQKDDLLAIIYTRDFLAAQQSYLYALKNQESLGKNADQSPAVIAQAQVDSSIDNLLAMGVSEIQIRNLARNREPAQNIELRAPVTGFVVANNLFSGLRFERGAELLRLADLHQVWILADVFGREADYIPPGLMAGVTVAGGNLSLRARVADSLPQFDAATRTMKIRLEAQNRDYRLRPGMFVDVAFPVKLPASLSVPADAVVDTGERKTVFLDRGNGYFEPRLVETGWRFGDRIEIRNGLSPGERIVLAGSFLLNSESRLQGVTPDRPAPVVTR